jgi:hypothetical protein
MLTGLGRFDQLCGKGEIRFFFAANYGGGELLGEGFGKEHDVIHRRERSNQPGAGSRREDTVHWLRNADQ